MQSANAVALQQTNWAGQKKGFVLDLMTEPLVSNVRREKSEDIFALVTQVTRFVTPLYSGEARCSRRVPMNNHVACHDQPRADKPPPLTHRPRCARLRNFAQN